MTVGVSDATSPESAQRKTVKGLAYFNCKDYKDAFLAVNVQPFKGTGMARRCLPCFGWRRLQHWIILLFGAVWLSAFAVSGAARANAVIDVNNALLNIIINTSAALVDGPPEHRCPADKLSSVGRTR
jgi:hypothetical protein